MYPNKIHKLARVVRILAQNLLLFPLSLRRAKQFLSFIYEFDPIPVNAPSSLRVSTTEQRPTRPATVFELFDQAEKMSINLGGLRLQEYGNMSYEELCTMALIVRCLQPENIFEIGTFDGTTTLQMALNSPANAKILTLNLPPHRLETKYPIGVSPLDLNLPFAVSSGVKFRDIPESAKITQLFGDSAAFDFSPYDKRMDLVLVDASHLYDYVKNDTEQAFMMIKQSGVILWHDYPRGRDVARCLDDLASRMPIHHLTGTSLALYRSV